MGPSKRALELLVELLPKVKLNVTSRGTGYGRHWPPVKMGPLELLSEQIDINPGNVARNAENVLWGPNKRLGTDDIQQLIDLTLGHETGHASAWRKGIPDAEALAEAGERIRLRTPVWKHKETAPNDRYISYLNSPHEIDADRSAFIFKHLADSENQLSFPEEELKKLALNEALRGRSRYMDAFEADRANISRFRKGSLEAMMADAIQKSLF